MPARPITCPSQRLLFEGGFVSKRAEVVRLVPEFEQLRDSGEAIKRHTLENLDYYLERYETAVRAQCT